MYSARLWAQRAGVATLVAVSLLAGTIALPHSDGPDDFVCIPIVVNHDESAHFIGGAPPASAADTDHCFLCHSVRSFFSAFEKYEQREGAPRIERLHASPMVVAGRLEWSLASGRAPPV